VTEPLDAGMLARLDTVVADATAALEALDYTRALERIEAFFWTFCDDYVELVKERAYGDGPGAQSARIALRRALDVLVRLFAPVLPFVTDEVWSWTHDASIHVASWPVPAGDGGDPAVLDAASALIAAVRRDKGASMRTEVAEVTIPGDTPGLALLHAVEQDLRSAAHTKKLVVDPA
jgi:valyl-tRNA synthetase